MRLSLLVLNNKVLELPVVYMLYKKDRFMALYLFAINLKGKGVGWFGYC